MVFLKNVYSNIGLRPKRKEKEKTMKKKKTGKAGKIVKTILKILGIILAVIVVLILICAIRHAFKNRSDRKLYKDAYGQYFTTSSGDRLNYTFMDSDSEKVAVILPGMGCASTRYEFDAFAKEINDDYKLILVDPLGYGLSDQASTPRTVENYCSELHELMNSLEYDKYTIIGHSIAGIYAVYYANTYTDEVEAFIGIDASAPHQMDADMAIAKPDNMVTLYTFMKYGLYETGIYRIMTELGKDQVMATVPDLSKEDQDKYLALYCETPLNKTQMDEVKHLGYNMEKTYDMKFPESIPVLYVLSQDNCNTMDIWEPIHKDLVTNPDSKIVIIEGAHYLHQTNFDGLINEIDNWKYEE